MKTLSAPPPSFFFVAILGINPLIYRDARELVIKEFGTPLEEIEPSRFDHTDYYQEEMGAHLIKGFMGFPPPFSPDDLVQRKLISRKIEWHFIHRSTAGRHRQINIDPGYITLYSVILSTSKNFSHRIYLGQGIFAESTLLYHATQWEPLPWTYPDYKIPEIQQFLTRCRTHLKHFMTASRD